MVQYMRESYGYTGLQVKNLPTLVIPSQIEGKDVVSINFSNNISSITKNYKIIKGITEIVYPNTAQDLGENFIILCDIEKLTLQEGLLKISTGAFGGMNKLKSITIPASVEEIVGYPFIGCSKDIEINILGKDSIEDFTFTSSGYPHSNDPFYSGIYSGGIITKINYLGK